MSHAVTTIIDQARCIGCGACVEACPASTLSMKDGKAVVSGDVSIGCGHCAAICPVGAVTVPFIEPQAWTMATLLGTDAYREPGKDDAAALVRLMRSRRSVRAYKPTPVPREVLEDLVRIGTTAPSGTNCQLWSFTILPTREAVEKLGDAMARFFEELNRKVKSPFVRGLGKLFMHDEPGMYYRDYYEVVRAGLEDYRSGRRDRLFYGAPAVLLIGSKPGASCPMEDAMLAAGHILLAAHAMGYGSCLIGFAVEALKRDPRVKAALAIPKDEAIYAAIALGTPTERYRRQTGRHTPALRVIE